jgi:hypothetical protein
VDRFEPSAETAALRAVLKDKPEEAERILGDFLDEELWTFADRIGELSVLVAEELTLRSPRDA